MKKVLKIILIVLLSMITLTFLVFYTPDYSQDKLEHKYLTPHSTFINIEITSLNQDGLPIEIHYQDYGEPNNPVIVLLHGAFSSSHTFIPWAETLVEAGYRIILIDLPYFGFSKGFSDLVTSYRRSSEVVNELLKALEIETIHIGGNSLGGAVSWYFASEYPEKVESLLLIDALPPISMGEDRRTISPFFQSKLVSNVISQLTPQFLLTEILKTAYGNPDRLTKATIDRYFDILRRDQTRAWLFQVSYEEIIGPSLEERLSLITAPVLLLWGELDTWIPLMTVEYFQTALQLDHQFVITYPDLGHVPMEEDPTTVTDYMAFLTQISGN